MVPVKSILQSVAVIALCVAATFFFVSAADAAGGNKANFKWVYHYDATQNEGELTVTIYDAACKVPEATHVYPSVCKVHNDHIACEVDIQAAANDAYGQEGYDPLAGAAESYPLIFAEVTGKMAGKKHSPNGTIIDHPSLVYNIQTSSANSARFMTNWSGTTAHSDFVGYNPNTLHTMRTSFGGSKFFHEVDGSHLNTQYPSASQLPFRLDKTTFKIYQPNGFELDNFVVDPPRCGFG